jgi:hypothetical protein
MMNIWCEPPEKMRGCHDDQEMTRREKKKACRTEKLCRAVVEWCRCRSIEEERNIKAYLREEQKVQQTQERDTDAGRAEQCSRTMMRLVSHR